MSRAMEYDYTRRPAQRRRTYAGRIGGARWALMPPALRRGVPYSRMPIGTTGNYPAFLQKKRGVGFTKEMRGCDTSIAVAIGGVLATVTTNGAAILLNGVQRGTGSFNRLGRKITMKSLRVKADIACTHIIQLANGDQHGNTLRMVVVYDRQTNGGAIPNYNLIFGQTDQAGAETGNIYDSLRYDNTGRFAVLMDKVITSNPGSPGAAAASDLIQNRFFCDEYIKLKNLETFFSDTQSPMTNTEIATGSLYIYFRATINSNLISEWAVAPASFARLRYYD